MAEPIDEEYDIFLDNDWLREIEVEQKFNIGGANVVVSLSKTGTTNVCVNEKCYTVGAGEEVYKAVTRLLESLDAT